MHSHQRRKKWQTGEDINLESDLENILHFRFFAKTLPLLLHLFKSLLQIVFEPELEILGRDTVRPEPI